jgi:hypothetical protein
MTDWRRDELARLRARLAQVEAEIADDERALDELAVQLEGGPEADRRFYAALRQMDREEGLEELWVKMTPQHPLWDHFFDRLEGPEGCDMVYVGEGEFEFRCEGDHRYTRLILSAMGLDEHEIAASLGYFAAHGGCCCDCEVLFNVDRDAAA